MNDTILLNKHLPSILILQDSQIKVSLQSEILALFNQVYLSLESATEVFSWVQEHQPELIILDLEYSKIVELDLISTLRLDWLTRNIPILISTNLASNQIQSIANLDCDAYLIKPYSSEELEQTIGSLMSNFTCQLSPTLHPSIKE